MISSPTLPPEYLPDVYLGPYSGTEALAIGFSMALWGATCMQMFLYFTNNFKDGRLLQTTVVFVWVLNTANEFVLLSGLYVAIVTGEILLIGNGRIEYLVSIWFTVLVGVATQSFFAYRIYKFSKNTFAAAILVSGVFSQLVIGTALFAIEIRQDLEHSPPPTVGKAVVMTTLLLSAVMDLSLSVGLCFFLWNAYPRGDLRVGSTTAMLQMVTLVTVNSGLWTAACAIVIVVLAAVFPDNLLFNSFSFLLAPLYCNSLLGSLNARVYMRSEATANLGNTTQLSTFKTCNPAERSAVPFADALGASESGAYLPADRDTLKGSDNSIKHEPMKIAVQ
ncbi:hypothetical protein BDY19DRAFT_454401 [Irpex rosettiformis]|uniref:Uncharacterized protein n=1 Tax=Irpex rosettiformis TaxID=378272 RepID=A0ACB8TT67_9APHY|nr:hypothetical protein BDY19DRAFT_454401 [Irpex rosettiformis]